MEENWDTFAVKLLQSKHKAGLNFSREILKLKVMGADHQSILEVFDSILKDFGFDKMWQPNFRYSAMIYFEYEANTKRGAQASLGRKYKRSRENVRQIIARQARFWKMWQEWKPRIKTELYNRVLEKIIDQK